MRKNGHYLAPKRLISDATGPSIISAGIQDTDGNIVSYRLLNTAENTLLDGMVRRPDSASWSGNDVWFRGPPKDAANSVPDSRAIWKSDASNNGTLRVSDDFKVQLDDTLTHIEYNGVIMPFTNGALYAAPDVQRPGNSIWKLDANDPNAANFLLTTYQASTSSWPIARMSHQNQLYATTLNGRTQSLYQVGLASANEIKIDTVFRNFDRFEFLTIDDKLLIHNTTDATLWLAEANGAEPVQVLWQATENRSSELLGLVASQGSLWFMESLGFPDQGKLWSTDGTQEGTQLRVDYNLEISNFSNASLVSNSKQIFFHAEDSLWATDGSFEGTIEIKSSSAADKAIVSMGNEVLFSVRGASEIELWQTDGSLEGTRSFTEPPLFASPLKSDGDRVLLRLEEEGVQRTSVETGLSGARLREISYTNAQTKCLETGKRQLMIAHNDGVHGREPTRYDCRTGDKRLLTDLTPGPQGSNPLAILGVGDLYYYSASTAETGRELYSTDILSGNTRLVADIISGSESSNAGITLLDEGILKTADSLVFPADDGSGTKLWAIPLLRKTERNLRTQELP